MTSRTAGELLRAGLGALGVERCYGESLPGVVSVPVADPDQADLLADVDGRLGRLGASFHGGVLRLSSRPGSEVEALPVTDPGGLAAALATPVGQEVPGTFALRLDLDLDAPVPSGVEPRTAQPQVQGLRLSPDLVPDLGVVVGPGVLRSERVADLRAFAEATGLPIVNTWGAKGVFAWDSASHAGTAGLQARDFELAGLTEKLFVVTVGLDPDEWPPGGAGGAQRLDLHPQHLALAAEGWPAPEGDPPRPPLYTDLAVVVGPAYESDAVPLHPARATRDLGGLRPQGGVVVADAGDAGLWVARAFPTTEPGIVVVPATRAPGTAVAASIVGGLAGRPVLGVTTWPLDEATQGLLDLARQLELPVALEAWGGEGAVASPEERVEVTADAVGRPGVDVVAVPVDLDRTADLVAVAGEVVAWAG